MANIRSFPNNQDEYIGAEEVMRWHHGRSSGVFGADGNAAVSPVLDAMAVTVSDGIGWLTNAAGNGVVWWVDNEAKTGGKLQIAVDMADAVLPRIDRVAVSWQTTNYVALPEVKMLKGTPASNPTPPALTNDNMERQISLAAIRIPAGVTALDASMITDERLDASVCGIVTETVGVDTSVMQAQFAEFFRKSIEDQERYIQQQKSAWDTFFDAIEYDTIVPVPTVEDKNKAVLVNEDGNGYTLAEIQTNIPVTNDPPTEVELWIDPTEENDTITPESIGAARADDVALIEKVIPTYASEHSAPRDLLNVTLSNDYSASNMQPGNISTEDASTLTNSPITSGAFYATRTVKYYPVGHVEVRLEEMYPCTGRIWSNMYDKNMKAWRGWKCSAVAVDAQVGVEQMTAETFNGKPVYTKLVNCGVVPSQSIKLVAHGASVWQMLRVHASLSTSGITAPYMNADNYNATANYLDVTATATNVLVKCTVSAWATNGYTLTAQIWYTKP